MPLSAVPGSTSPANIVAIRKNASLLLFLRDPLAFFHEVADHSGSLAEIRLGGRRFYLVNNPELIHDLLVTSGSSFEKFPPGNPKQRLFGKGLLTSEGSAQKEQRRILLPGFHRGELRLYASQMVANAEALMAATHLDRNFDAAAFMNTLALRVIGQCLFGITDYPLLAELGRHLAAMLHVVNRFVLPWGDVLMRLPLPSSIRYWRASKRLDEIVYGLLQQARRQPPAATLLSVLLTATHADGTPLTDSEIRDEVVTMIIAGHETVAVGLTWCLHLLAENPAIQDRLARQTAEALGGADPTVDHYPQLEFLHHAFAESLRLFPPIWIMGRRALVDYSFANFNAPQGSVFLICLADLHRRAGFFPAPLEFRPERWLNPTWSPHAFIPFGAGARRCIGERFAWLEAVLFLACLLRRWRFSSTGPPPAAIPQLTLHPKDAVWLRISARAQAAVTSA